MAARKAIATRIFESAGGSVKATFFAPVADRQDWRCDYRIDWPERTQYQHAMGVDGVQALLLAMKMVRAELTTAPEVSAAALTWLGEADLGLPE